MGGWKKQLRDSFRWPKYKDLYICAFEKMLQARRAKGRETRWETGEEVWNWWTSPPKSKYM